MNVKNSKMLGSLKLASSRSNITGTREASSSSTARFVDRQGSNHSSILRSTQALPAKVKNKKPTGDRRKKREQAAPMRTLLPDGKSTTKHVNGKT